MSFQCMVCDESLYPSVMKSRGIVLFILRAQFLNDVYQLSYKGSPHQKLRISTQGDLTPKSMLLITIVHSFSIFHFLELNLNNNPGGLKHPHS